MIDGLVQTINRRIEPLIDCTKCGACCKGLMINVTDSESENVSDYLNMNKDDFEDKFIEKSSGGMMIMNKIPCHFLIDTKCSIYENRFNECRDFPHIHKPGFNDRLFGTLIHYAICPIIFNVIEQLKVETDFFKN